MLTRRTLLITTLALASTSAANAAEASPQELVATADTFRLPKLGEGGVKMTVRMTDGQGLRKSITRLSVTSRAQSALVQLEDGDSAGMKILATPEGNWMYLPNTRRAVRITPVQLLRGNTNVGDLSRLSFDQDYDAAFAADRTATLDGRACWVLALKAKSQASTYAALTLYVERSSGAPVKAEVFLASGKRLKTILFDPPATLNGRRVVTAVTYIDGVNPDRKTLVETLSAESVRVTAGMFKPEALAAAS